jgi:hypothetical protein
MVIPTISQQQPRSRGVASGNDRSMQQDDDEETPRVSHRKTKPEMGLFYTNSADFSGAAEAVSTGLNSAMNTLSGFASFFPREEEDPIIEKLERQLQTQAQKVSYTMVGEEKKEEQHFVEPVGDDDNTLMSDGRSPPQRFDAQPPSENSCSSHASSSAFKLHRPIPMQASESSNSTAGSSSNRSRATSSASASAKSSKGSRAIAITNSSPMARMRNSYAQLASSLDADVMASAPHKRPKTMEEIRTAKQRKWKKHMKLAKERRHQERRELEEDDTPDYGPGGPGFMDAMLERILPEPHKLIRLVQTRCGNIEDVSESDDSNFSGSSEDVSEASSNQEESRAANAASSQARSSTKSAARRRGRSRQPRPAKSSPDSRRTSLPRSNSRTSVARSNSRSRYSSTSERSASQVPSSATGTSEPSTLPPKESRHPERPCSPESSSIPASLLPSEIQSPQSSHAIVSSFLYSPDISTESQGLSARTDYPMDSLTKKALELNILPDSSVGSRSGSETLKQTSSSAPYKHQANTTVSPSAMNADPTDKSFVKTFIQDVMTQGCPLHWHSEPMSMAPHFVKMHLKSGHRAPSGSQCGPRLVWVDMKTPDNTFGIDLFDIRSLDKAGSMHLQDYPFAIPGRSIFLKATKGRDFVFEAGTEEQARRFIHGMRWVVARLAFNLVIGNLDVSCELMDVGLMDDGKKKDHPDTALEESRWTKAMDDVTNELVDKLAFHL